MLQRYYVVNVHKRQMCNRHRGGRRGIFVLRDRYFLFFVLRESQKLFTVNRDELPDVKRDRHFLFFVLREMHFLFYVKS